MKSDIEIAQSATLLPMEEIARKTGFSLGKIKSMLHRTRKKLAASLQKEGLE